MVGTKNQQLTLFIDTPKQIYRCDFPDCYRSFVRQDLCIRHRERHTTRGSQLQKRDHFAQAASHLQAKPLVPSNADAFSASSSNGSKLLPATSKLEQLPSPTVSEPSRPIALASSSSSPPAGAVGAYPSYSYPQAGVEWSDYGFSQSTGSSHAVTSPSMQSTATHGQYAPMSGRSSPHTSVSSGELGQESQMHMQANDCVTTTGGSQTIDAPYHPIMTDMNGTSLVHPTSAASMPVGGGFNHNLSMGTTASTPATTLGGGLDSGMITAGSTVSDNFDTLSPCAYPVVGSGGGSETYNRTPFGMADDFAAWLFNDGRGPTTTATASQGMMPSYLESAQQMSNPFFLSEPSFNGVFNHVLTQHPMNVTSILDSSSTTSSFPAATQTILSPKKRQDLLHLISTRFNEAAYSTGSKRKDCLMAGDLDNENHVLSLRMIQTYLGSYWSHMHPQLPILHLPTFIADQTPNLLLLAMIVLGASTLQHGGGFGTEVIERAAELAIFIAWHLRWELFMDADFRPPAKLWVFQALLLLEVHEKRYSTRALHERAHIHHDTTLTLMRRGSSLFSTTTTTTTTPPTATAGQMNEDSSWANWTQAEGRRRVAFAALVLDATHATMFGHSVKMVAHELRLPLPCDEAMWSAPSAVDVVRIQQDNQPVLFLDGLKKTLNDEPVHTNAFGRAVLMAGLLSVSWHMNQRDLQVTSLGVPHALGGRDKWRSSLLRAFDNWRRDYDEPYNYVRTIDEATLESRDMLHGLAHIASHVDIVDCQIFAGAGRLMGRTITARDYDLAREKMIAWVAKASARDATFYALKVLTRVLGCGNGGHYSAGNDFLLHRPWVVYLAALVVWCYGYALDGPLFSSSSSMTVSKSDQIQNMRAFLRRVGGVRDPSELQTVSGRNDSLGLLMVLRDSFMQQQRWELMEEAAGLLGSCIGKLYGV